MSLVILCVPVLVAGRWTSDRVAEVGDDGIDRSVWSVELCNKGPHPGAGC